jgi:excisionase family DNA binding protein
MDATITDSRLQGQEDIDRLLSVDLAAELLSISPWTVRKWIVEGKIKTCKLGSRRLIPRSEIKRIIDETIK